MKKQQQKEKLAVDLIPAQAWGRNVRAVVSDVTWGDLRRKFGAIFDPYINYPNPTAPIICNGCGNEFTANLHLHEVWEFDDDNLVQQLVKFIAVCEDCHNAIHIGRSNKVGLGDSAMAHLKDVNGWTDLQLEKHLNKANALWLKRINFEYQLDLNWLLEGGWVAPNLIHLNWLVKPKRVYNRVDAIEWANTILSSTNAVILDTETTGLIEGPIANPNAEIVELAIISVSGEVLFNKRVKPLHPIPERTMAIHGITNTAVRRCHNFAKWYPEIHEILSGKIVVCYNTRFDGRILKNTCKLHGITPPEDVMWECAMKVYKAYQEPNTRFSRLPGATHGALSDCMATLKLIERMSRNEVIINDEFDHLLEKSSD